MPNKEDAMRLRKTGQLTMSLLTLSLMVACGGGGEGGAGKSTAAEPPEDPPGVSARASPCRRQGLVTGP